METVGWSFHLCNFVEGCGFAGYLDGPVVAPNAKSKSTTPTTTTMATTTKAMSTPTTE